MGCSFFLFASKLNSPKLLKILLLFITASSLPQALYSQNTRNRILPDPYYPQQPTGELRLNYYYDRSGRWVKFSDWIPYQKHKYVPRHLEDLYGLYGLPNAYLAPDIKRNIYFLSQATLYKFRHPSRSLCKIETEEQFHKYRLLMFMQVNKLIMRMFLRLASSYDTRQLYFHDLDFADDLERSFLIARSYYHQALPFWKKSLAYAKEASQYPFILDLPGIESTRFKIITGKLDFGYITEGHLKKLETKLRALGEFLDQEGRPRPIKKAIQKDIEKMYDKDFQPTPLDPPALESQ